MRHIAGKATEVNRLADIAICGEIAGRPLEAMAFVALGFRRLSMPAAGIGPVKRMILSLDAAEAAEALQQMLRADGASVRAELTEFASEMKLPL